MEKDNLCEMHAQLLLGTFQRQIRFGAPTTRHWREEEMPLPGRRKNFSYGGWRSCLQRGNLLPSVGGIRTPSEREGDPPPLWKGNEDGKYGFPHLQRVLKQQGDQESEWQGTAPHKEGQEREGCRLRE